MYITYPSPERRKSMSFEDLMGDSFDIDNAVMYDPTNTVTRFCKNLDNPITRKYPFHKEEFVEKLRSIRERYDSEYQKTSWIDSTYSFIRAKKKNIKGLEKKIEWETKHGASQDAARARAAFEAEKNALAVATRRMNSQEDFPYYSFDIPKRTGGTRRIDAPKEKLSAALVEVRDLLTNAMPADHHTTAFAYTKGRACIDLMKKHHKWNSRWFCKFDFSDFFGTVTLEFTMRMLKMQYPFCLLNDEETELLSNVLSLGFAANGLPQGTPLSPALTNLIMIPFDHYISSKLDREIGTKMEVGKNYHVHFVYTRYADDILISCRYKFDPKQVESLIMEAIHWFKAPFILNVKKTTFGNCSGSNYHFGMIINADHKIALGSEKNRQLKAMIQQYGCDKINHIRVYPDRARCIMGNINYLHQIDPGYCKYVLDKYGKKFGFDIMSELKMDAKRT